MKDIRKENVNIDEILTDIKSSFSTRTYKSIKKRNYQRHKKRKF